MHATFSTTLKEKAKRRPDEVRLVAVTVLDPDTNDICTIKTVMAVKHSNELLQFILGHEIKKGKTA